MRFSHYFSVVSLAVALAGCDCQTSSNDADGNIINIRTAKSGIVFAKVGEKNITCGDFRQRLEFECAIWRNCHAKLKNDASAIDKFSIRRMPSILPTLVNQTGLSLWAGVLGVTLTDEERRSCERNTLRQLGFKGDVDTFAKKVGCTAEYASKQLCASALESKVIVAFDPATTNMTEKEIDEGLGRLAAYYDRAIASNAVTWATCSNVIAKIAGGLDFAEAARRFSYSDAEEGVEWGDFAPVEIEDVKLKGWAYSAPVGSIRIFELDDGISIVKILGREDGTIEPSVVTAKEASAKLARINFAMVEPEPEPRTREHVREELLKWKKREAQKRLWDEITKKFPITYPNENAKIAL